MDLRGNGGQSVLLLLLRVFVATFRCSSPGSRNTLLLRATTIQGKWDVTGGRGRGSIARGSLTEHVRTTCESVVSV